jgi:hypothetical protein
MSDVFIRRYSSRQRERASINRRVKRISGPGSRVEGEEMASPTPWRVLIFADSGNDGKIDGFLPGVFSDPGFERSD